MQENKEIHTEKDNMKVKNARTPQVKRRLKLWSFKPSFLIMVNQRKRLD